MSRSLGIVNNMKAGSNIIAEQWKGPGAETIDV